MIERARPLSLATALEQAKRGCLRCAEAAAFLDGLASRLDPYMADPIRNKQAAADCRAMAAKLRGQT